MKQQQHDIHLVAGETRLIDWNWSGEAEEHGSTVSTSAWELDQNASGAFSIASPTLASGHAKVNLSAADAGTAVLKNTATLANGEALIRWAVVDAMKIYP